MNEEQEEQSKEDKLKELFPELDVLWDADPNCKHDVQSASFGGGVKCTKCRGWFCY